MFRIVKIIFGRRNIKLLFGLSCIALYLRKRVIAQLLKQAFRRICYTIEKEAFEYKKSLRPEKIIIVRHGESLANIDVQVYAQLPDNQIPLTDLGKLQALEIGKKLQAYIGEDKQVLFFVSSFLRAQLSARQILKNFKNCKKFITEPRIREQEWGNLQKFQKHPEKCSQILAERSLVGRFYYRFETGESASDVYDRVGIFLDQLFREMDSFSCQEEGGNDRVFIIVTHGMVMRLLHMKYFKQSIEEFDVMENPKNCEAWILQKSSEGSYYFDQRIQLDSQEHPQQSS